MNAYDLILLACTPLTLFYELICYEINIKRQAQPVLACQHINQLSFFILVIAKSRNTVLFLAANNFAVIRKDFKAVSLYNCIPCLYLAIPGSTPKLMPVLRSRGRLD